MIDLTDISTATIPVEAPVFLRFSSSSRIYSAILQQDLLGDWTVMQSWGGRFNRRGGGKIQLVKDFAAGLKVLGAITKQRQRHGYAQLF